MGSFFTTPVSIQKLVTNHKTNTVFVIGYSKHNAFGSRNPEQITSLTKLSITHNIVDIKCSKRAVFYIDDKGSYWTAGEKVCDECRIGSGGLSEILYFKKRFIKIKRLITSPSQSSMFWISEENGLYANGNNDHYQLGTYRIMNENKPLLVNSLHNIIDVAVAENYSIVLCTVNVIMIIVYWFRINEINIIISDIIQLIKRFYGRSNTVFSTTYSKYGGNGQHTTDYSYNDHKWHRIKQLKSAEIIQISCGYDFSLFLESNGTVWSCGSNSKGQLARATNNTTPTTIYYLIKRKIKIKRISCGYNHCMAVDSNDKVYSWGDNEYGQCGYGHGNDGTKRVCIRTPKMLKLLGYCKINEIQCGDYHSYVCATINDPYAVNKDHYLFGNNCYQQCVLKGKTKITSPQRINDEIPGSIQSVHLGDLFTLFILSGK